MQAMDDAYHHIADLTHYIATEETRATETMDVAEKKISKFSQSFATVSRLLSGGRKPLMPHGGGLLHIPDRGTFIGDCFYKGTLQGYGICELPDGSVYTGEFAANKCMGPGALVFPDGMKLEGDWVSNKLHGYGQITQIVGDIWNSSGSLISIKNTITFWAWHGKLYKTRKEWEITTQLEFAFQMKEFASDRLRAKS